MESSKVRLIVFVAVLIVFQLGPPFIFYAHASYRFADFEGRPPLHIFRSAQAAASGVTPAEIKAAYKLPAKGGKGTIAIIDAYDDPSIEADLAVFDRKFGLSVCTAKNGCFEKHAMAASVQKDTNWSMEISLDVEWAHAIAPSAKILLVEAKTQSGVNLLSAIDYARSRKDVVAISMSWGGPEFSDERSYDAHLVPKANPAVAFFASSGDNGAGVSWPAASPHVIAVGGTTLSLSSKGTLIKETAWQGSGGGVSAYEPEPAYQASYKIPRAGGMRAVPDVAYNADASSGYPIYYSGAAAGSAKGWYVVGGTSAGAPQWAAIRALGSVSLASLYADKASSRALSYFRDITSGANGDCSYYCDARAHYDYVTGLGTPQTYKF